MLTKKGPFITVSRITILLLLCMYQSASAQQSTRLTDHWEFLRQDLGGIWEAVRPVAKGDPGSVPVWQTVSLCPTVSTHWMRSTPTEITTVARHGTGHNWTSITLIRTAARCCILKAQDRSRRYTYIPRKSGSHTGGYDEWTVDITDAVTVTFAQSAICREQFKGKKNSHQHPHR